MKSPAVAVSNELSLSASALAWIQHDAAALHRWRQGLFEPAIVVRPDWLRCVLLIR